ncbi:MAG: hydroxyacid dehydrogenase [Clostridia bacterium]|nr:hydroxyacid dehydrogenase [Deltaproteobacteria bacterium]
MKALVADAFPETARNALAAAGIEVTYEPESGSKGLSSLGGYDIVVVRSSKLTGEAIRSAKHLQLIVRAGAGVNTIDVAAASKLGVYVTNCPGKNAVAVAELTFALLLGVDRQIASAAQDLRSGTWNKKTYSKADGIFGKTLGIVGFGTIGREVAARAHAFGLHVVAWSRSLDNETAEAFSVERASDLSFLAARSDIVTIHLPLTSETKQLIDKTFIDKLSKGTILINVARDGIVDESAIADAVSAKGLRYATDVFEGEPSQGQAPFVHPLAQHKGVLATPHIGASTEQAQNAVADEAVRIITTFARTGAALNCVNIAKTSPARCQLVVRHLDKVGVLAHMLETVRAAGINVEEVENVIFEGAHAASARIRLGQEPTSALLDTIANHEHVLDARLVSLA